MNEIGNVYDVVFHDYSNLFNRLNRVTSFLKDEFIYGGHLASLGVSFIALSTILLFDITIKWEFILIVYFSTLCIYNYDHYKEFRRDSSGNLTRTLHLKRYSRFLPLIISVYGIVSLTLLFYFGNFESVLFAIALLLFGLLYTEKFKKITKKIVGFKNFYTSFSISLLIILTAIFYNTFFINWTLILIFSLLFLRLMINTSYCDIKDIESDKKENLLTLPIVFGRKNFLVFLHILNIFFIVLTVLGIYLELLPLYSIFLVASSVYSFFYLYKTRNVNTDVGSVSSTLVDGEFIIWPVLLLVGKVFVGTM